MTKTMKSILQLDSKIDIVKAIGNQTYLTSSLCQKNSGFVDKYNNSGKSVKLEKQRNIKIPKYSGNIEIKYMKEATEK